MAMYLFIEVLCVWNKIVLKEYYMERSQYKCIQVQETTVYFKRSFKTVHALEQWQSDTHETLKHQLHTHLHSLYSILAYGSPS